MSEPVLILNLSGRPAEVVFDAHPWLAVTRHRFVPATTLDDGTIEMLREPGYKWLVVVLGTFADAPGLARLRRIEKAAAPRPVDFYELTGRLDPRRLYEVTLTGFLDRRDTVARTVATLRSFDRRATSSTALGATEAAMGPFMPEIDSLASEATETSAVLCRKDKGISVPETSRPGCLWIADANSLTPEGRLGAFLLARTIELLAASFWRRVSEGRLALVIRAFGGQALTDEELTLILEPWLALEHLHARRFDEEDWRLVVGRPRSVHVSTAVDGEAWATSGAREPDGALVFLPAAPSGAALTLAKRAVEAGGALGLAANATEAELDRLESRAKELGRAAGSPIAAIRLAAPLPRRAHARYVAILDRLGAADASLCASGLTGLGQPFRAQPFDLTSPSPMGGVLVLPRVRAPRDDEALTEPEQRAFLRALTLLSPSWRSGAGRDLPRAFAPLAISTGLAAEPIERLLDGKRRDAFLELMRAGLATNTEYDRHFPYNRRRLSTSSSILLELEPMTASQVDPIRTLAGVRFATARAFIDRLRGETARAATPTAMIEAQVSGHEYLQEAADIHGATRAFIQRLGLEPLGAVLELGSGPGRVARLLAPRSSSYVAIDLGLRALAAAATTAGVLPLVADIQRLPLANARFDLVLADNVLEHAASPLRAFAEVRRVLKPGGRLAALVPLEAHGVDHDLPLHLWKTDLEGLRTAAEASGLSVSCLEQWELHELDPRACHPSCGGRGAFLLAVR